MADSDDNADVAFIRALAALLREQDLSEMHIKRDFGEAGGRLDVRLSRVSTTTAPPPPPAPAPAAPAPAEAPAAAAMPAIEDPALLPGAVTSPMVGTAYLAPEPGAAAFVAVGDTVSEGQTLLIVEAMKTMNQIPAPTSGRVARILVEDGAPVEFGAPLMILD